MIEKIARAHYAEYMRGVEDLEPSWGQLPDDHRDRMIGAMREALKALETPAPELDHILCVGSDTLCFEMGLEQIDHRGTVLAVFTAMIKAAQEQD